MALTQWIATGAFAALLMCVALYGLAVSGHFPAEHRAETLRTPAGAAILWTTMAIALLAIIVAIAFAWRSIPWYAAVIGGGGVLLAAPLVLQAFPDSFVDGRAALTVFATASIALALLMTALG